MNIGIRLLSECPELCAAWLALLLLLCWFTSWGIRRSFGTTRGLWRQIQQRGLIAVWNTQSGASYAISVLLLLPLYLIICLFFTESTLFLTSKLGTIYAAYAGARSVAVWDWLDEDVRDDRLHQAVLTALGGYVASGHERGSQAGTPQWAVRNHLREYLTAAERLSGRNLDRARMETHLTRVAARTTIDLEIPQRRHSGDVSVAVTYRAPILFASVARLIPTKRKHPYELLVRSEVTLTMERPQTATGTMGIRYRAF